MLIDKITITNQLGLHARSANQLVKLAQELDAKITLSNGEHQAEASSMVDLLILAATVGTELEIRVEGVDEEDEKEALQQIMTLFHNNFGEKQ